jgi:hypothetical protein
VKFVLLGCTVGRTGQTRKTDYGTVILHWLLVGLLAIAIATGLRIATESPDRTWINILDLVLPAAAVWTWHLQCAVLLIAVGVAYVVYVSRLRLGQRIRFDQVRLRGLLGRRYARWGAINIVLYWLFFLVMLSQFMTGVLLYLGYANSFMVWVHWIGLWLILGYIPLHLCSQWKLGGAAQMLRIFRPSRLVAPLPQLELADVVALLDQQSGPSLAPQRPAFARALTDGPSPAQRFAAGSSSQVFQRSPLTGGDVLEASHQSAPNSSTPNSPNSHFAIHLNAFLVACVMAGLIATVALMAEREIIDRLYIHRIDSMDIPAIDGETSDSIWRKIPPIHVLTEKGGNFQGTGETTVSIQAVHDGSRAYFLFIWDDPTRSLKQLPLRKMGNGWVLLHDGYEIGDERAYNEDKFSVLLTSINSILAGDSTFHAGTAPVAGEPRTLSGRGLHYTTQDSLFADVWEWKATSTNASGFCDDDHFGPPTQGTPAQFEGSTPYRGGFAPDPGSANYQDNFLSDPMKGYAEGVVPRRLPKDFNNMNAALGRVDLDPDHGESETARWYMSEQESVPYSLESDRLIPNGAVVPGVIISGEYSGDRADVRCAGHWAAGRWALEVTRRLEVDSRYDVPIRSGTFMRVAAFDHSQIRHTRHVRPIRLEVE